MTRYEMDENEAWDALDELVAEGARVSVHNRAVSPWACHIILNIGTPQERVCFEYGETRAKAIEAALDAVHFQGGRART